MQVVDIADVIGTDDMYYVSVDYNLTEYSCESMVAHAMMNGDFDHALNMLLFYYVNVEHIRSVVDRNSVMKMVNENELEFYSIIRDLVKSENFYLLQFFIHYADFHRMTEYI